MIDYLPIWVVHKHAGKIVSIPTESKFVLDLHSLD